MLKDTLRNGQDKIWKNHEIYGWLIIPTAPSPQFGTMIPESMVGLLCGKPGMPIIRAAELVEDFVGFCYINLKRKIQVRNRKIRQLLI